MHGRACFLLLLLLAVFVNEAFAREQATYHGCVDARGNNIGAVLDETLVISFETRIEDGRPLIRYNPSVLPRLKAETRLFLYAHECARLNLGMPAGTTPGVDEARRADCWGLRTLLRSGLLDASDVVGIQSDLRFSADEWSAVPGPPRPFDLLACYQEASSRPSLASPPAGQDDWNTCARVCGDTLRSCQMRTCRGPDCAPCMTAYDQCVTACDTRFAR